MYIFPYTEKFHYYFPLIVYPSRAGGGSLKGAGGLMIKNEKSDDLKSGSG